jgi:Sugar-transfer associated ATP-grasp
MKMGEAMLNLGKVKASAKQFAIKRGWIDWYEDFHKQDALRIVNCLEKHNGTKLTPQLKKTADDYALDVFGDKKYAPWLYVYSLLKGEFKEGWIPDNYYGKYVYPILNKELYILGEFKSFSNTVFKTEAFPDIAYYIDGFFYNRNKQIISIDKLKELICATGDKVFLKKDYSKRGGGIAKLSANEIDENAMKIFGNCVIQTAIHQHEYFDQFKIGSVATIRITTVKEPDGVFSMRAANLRFGLDIAEWIESTRRMLIAITNEDGDLDAYGYDSNWKKTLVHPDTHVPFANKRIPHFNLALETCLKLHSQVPHFGVIGWDLTIDKDNKVKLIEWNTAHSGISFNEGTVGPCFLGLNWEKLRNN